MEKLSRPYSSFLMLLLLTSVVGSCIIYMLPHLILRTGVPAHVAGPSMLAALVVPLVWGVVINPMRRSALSELGRNKITLENVVDAVVHFDERGNIESLNAAAERMFGYESGEIRGRKITEIIPQDVKYFSENAEISACHRSGTSFPAEAFVSRIQVGRRSSYVAIVHDISARKKAEQAVIDSEKRYHSLFQNMLNGIAYCKMLVDEQGNPHDFLYLDVNEAFSRLTGLEGVIGKRLTEVLPAMERSFEELFDIFARVILTGKPERFEFYVEDLDIWTFVSVFSPEPYHFVIIFDNITERKMAEKEILKAQTDWERTFDAIVDPIMILDTDHRIIKANKAVAAETGALPCSMAGARCCTWLHKSEDLACDCPHTALLEDGKAHSGEIHDQRQGKYFHVVVSPLYGADGELQGSIHFSRDITQQKSLEKQLQHAQKMEAIGTLAGGVAHDFNNILTAIMGYGTLAKMRVGEEDPAGYQLSALLEAADRAADLTRSLLTFSRKEKVVLKPCDLNDVIQHGRKMLRRLIREDIELNTDLADAALTVMADKGQIDQVLMNLAINAQDATPGGGHISIKSGVAEIDEEFSAQRGFGAPGRYAVIEVSDSGEGMDEETVQRIFEPFFTTKETGKGTGLRLAIVYGIVKQHGGFITCDSQKGVGSIFRVYLPLTDRSAEKEASGKKLPLPTGTETILVAEDDEQARKLLGDVLAKFGYRVITAVDGEDAVVQFNAQDGKVDLAVLDTVMPKRNGREAYLQMQQTNPAIKAVFTSGYPKAKKEMAGAGIAFLPKPILTKDLLLTVRRLLD